jgi:MATE family multidrug resistance protein
MIDIADVKPAPRNPWGMEVRATLVLAWPLILTNLTQVALGATDVVMMGWLGPESLAAGALATNLNFALVIFGIGLVTATAPLIASELGRRRHSVRDVRRTVRQGLWSALAISVPIWAVLWQAQSILLAIGQDPRLAGEAAAYIHTLMWSIAPFLGYIALRNFLSAMQRPLAALLIGGLGVLLNALLVWSLMFGRFGLPALGLRGAGIGTTLTSAFLFFGLAFMVTIDRRFHRYRLFGRFWRADWPRFRAIWKLGLPIAFTLGFEVTIFNAAAFLMGVIGADSLAAHAIAMQISSLAFMVPLGLGMAATVRVGRAFGAGDLQGAARAGWTVWWLAFVYACVAALVMIFAGRMLVGVFLALDDPANQSVIGLAVSFLVFAGIFQIVDGAQAAASGMLRGLHDARIPMILAGIGYWGIGLPLGVVLAFPLGLAGAGIWIGLATGLAVVAVLLTLRWMMRERFRLVGEVGRQASTTSP